jgi:hypothetical protein
VSAVVVVIAVGVAVLLLGTVVLVMTRLHALNRRVGSFECGVRLVEAGAGDGATGPRPWSTGIAQYGVGRLDWWRVWSLAPRPVWSWRRADLVVLGRHPMEAVGRPDVFAVRCVHRGVEFELSMSPDAYAGMMSWLESVPPRSGDRGA